MTKEVTLTTSLYSPGTAFLHRPSDSVEILTQDREDPTLYYLTVLRNRATPGQNNTTQRIRGSRNDGLLHHELGNYVCFYESETVSLWLGVQGSKS
jgi:hypothetical protein